MNKAIYAVPMLLLWAILPLSVVGQQQKRQIPPELIKKVEQLSGTPSFIVARELGMTKIAGKDITQAFGPKGKAKAKKLTDVPIGADPTKAENEPAVAANPNDKKHLVAGSHWSPDPVTGSNRCVAYYSSDGGQAWSDPFPMPQLPANPDRFCSDPALAYAPDGSRVYYAYMDIKQSVSEVPPLVMVEEDLDILVSYSDDDGVTWTGPVIALDGDPASYTVNTETGEFIINEPGFSYDKNWVGTHVSVGGPQGNSNWVYVTATRFDNTIEGGSHIAFTRSADKGQTWDDPLLLESSTGALSLVQGSRPSGGLGSDVLVAWYDSGNDGWLTGGFEIHTAYSADHGATFAPVATAAVDDFELPFWLGPFQFYKRWWAAMFPDVEVDAGGTAHIIYTHDPDENPVDPEFGPVSLTAEDGDVRYVYSAGAPYSTWSDPGTVNDDGLERTQGFAALETQHGGKSSTVHVIWEDTRLSPDLPIVGFPENLSPNLYYDIFYARKVPGKGEKWFGNLRVTEASSIQDWIFTGDYTDLAVNNREVFAVWTDRRDKDLPNCFPPTGCGEASGIYDFEDDVYGSEIVPGGGLGKTSIAAAEEAELPSEYALEQNYPNPYNPATVITYTLPEASNVQLVVYNALGQEVAKLAEGYQQAGRYQVTFDAGRLSAGVYLYTIRADGFTATNRMVLLK